MPDEKRWESLTEDIIIIKETLKSMVATNDLKLITVEEKLKVANNRIKDLEDNNRWLWRAISGAFISAAILFLFKK